MSAWRYWRIYSTANAGSSYTSIQELELRGTVGGSDLTSPGMATDQSSSYSETAAVAIDNDFTDYAYSTWVSSDGSQPQWVSVDLGSAQTVAEVAIWPQNYWGGPDRAPKDFLIQGSSDKSTWTTEATFTGITGWSAGTGKTFAVGGSSATDTPVNPGVGSLSLTGYAPTVARTDAQKINPGTGSIALTGYAPTLAQSNGAGVNPATGALSFTGYAPGIAQSAAQSVTPGAGVLTITGYAPSILQPQAIMSGTGPLTITGYAPSVAQAINQAVNPAAGGAAITGYPPVVERTNSQTVTIGAGFLALAGYAPGIAQAEASPVLTPGTGYFAATGYEPTIRQGLPRQPAGDYSGGRSKRLAKKKVVRTLAELNRLLQDEPPLKAVHERERVIVPPLVLVLSEDEENEEALMLLFA